MCATLNDWYERWIFCTYQSTPTNLALYRIAFACVLIVAEPPLTLWIKAFPDSFFAPPMGIMRFLHGFPPAAFFYALNCATMLALACVLFGYRTRLASIGLAAALLVSYAWTYSLGKIDHDTILFVVIPLILAFSSWGSALSLDSRRAQTTSPLLSAWPICLVMLLTACAMAFSGVAKASAGWLDPSTYSARGYVARAMDDSGQFTPLGPLLIDIDAVWWIADFAIVGVEVGLLIALPWRRAMQIACALAGVFHVMVYLLLGIQPFTANLMAYALLIDWERLWRSQPMRSLEATLRPWTRAIRAWHALGVGFLLFTTNVVIGNVVWKALSLVHRSGEQAFVFLELAIVLVVSVSYLLLVAGRLVIRLAYSLVHPSVARHS